MDSFDGWLAEIRAPRQGGKAWDSWPDVARGEVDRVVEMHRTGGKVVTLTQMVHRLRAHGVSTSLTNLRRYTEEVHGCTWTGRAISP